MRPTLHPSNADGKPRKLRSRGGRRRHLPSAAKPRVEPCSRAGRRRRGPNVDHHFSKVPRKHANGFVCFRFAAKKILDFQDYFQCLNFIRPLFSMPSFKEMTPGIYVNYIKDPNAGLPDGALRINYFSVDNLKTISAIDEFASHRTQTQLFESGGAYKERSAAMETVDDRTLKFRNCLNDCTHIDFDLLDALGPEASGGLLFYYGAVVKPQNIVPQVFLRPVFARFSAYYRAMEENSFSDQFWSDVTTIFPVSPTSPMHFLGNMLLGPYNIF